MLHEKCKGRVKQQYICERDDNVVVPRTEMVKGYEFAKEQYVVFTPDEIKKMEEEKTGLVDIAEFLDIKASRPRLLRERLLPRPRQGRREGLPPAVRRHEEDGPGRGGEMGGPGQAVPRPAAPAQERGRSCSSSGIPTRSGRSTRCRWAPPSPRRTN